MVVDNSGTGRAETPQPSLLWARKAAVCGVGKLLFYRVAAKGYYAYAIENDYEKDYTSRTGSFPASFHGYGAINAK